MGVGKNNLSMASEELVGSVLQVRDLLSMSVAVLYFLLVRNPSLSHHLLFNVQQMRLCSVFVRLVSKSGSFHCHCACMLFQLICRLSLSGRVHASAVLSFTVLNPSGPRKGYTQLWKIMVGKVAYAATAKAMVYSVGQPS